MKRLTPRSCFHWPTRSTSPALHSPDWKEPGMLPLPYLKGNLYLAESVGLFIPNKQDLFISGSTYEAERSKNMSVVYIYIHIYIYTYIYIHIYIYCR